MTRLLVLFVSEATPDLVDPWADAGLLPALAQLRRSGTEARSRYGTPYLLTPQLWATIETGRSAGHHGVFDYWQVDGTGRFQKTDGSWLRAPRFWEVLSANGARSCVVNVPLTYPPRPIDGIVISGQDAPGAHRSIAAPVSIYDELVKRFGPYRLKDVFPGGHRKEDYLELLEATASWQTRILLDLFNRTEWDLFIAYFSGPAMAQHYFWDEMRGEADEQFASLVGTAYRSFDLTVARLCEAAGADVTTIVMSECGAGPLTSGVQINTLLARAGLLRYRASADPRVSGTSGRTRRRLVATARRVGQQHLPSRLYYPVARLPLKRWIQDYLASSDIDWPETQVFYRGKGEGNLYVNLVGRFPHGSVSPENYEAVRDAAVDRLSETIDPGTGKRAITKIHRREELFDGPRVSEAPDLVIEWADTAYMPTEQDRDKEEIFVERWREYMDWPTTGSHRMDGLFLASGPAIRDGAQIEEFRLIDLAPSTLHLLGCPIPEQLEGRAARELFVEHR